jgi:hypothetical protein
MAGKQSICTNCGYVGYPKKTTKGRFLVELGLWILFLLPGIIYSIWRLSSRYEACPKCKNASMIPLDSPIGKELYSKQQNASG